MVGPVSGGDVENYCVTEVDRFGVEVQWFKKEFVTETVLVPL